MPLIKMNRYVVRRYDGDGDVIFIVSRKYLCSRIGNRQKGLLEQSLKYFRMRDVSFVKSVKKKSIYCPKTKVGPRRI